MGNSQLYIDFVENNLSLDEEKNFVNKLTIDDEFRSGFKGFLNIDGDIKSNIKIFGPSMEETNEIYSKLGYTIPAAIKPELPIVSNNSKYFNIQIFKFLATGILSSLVTLFIVFLLSNNNSKNNKIEAENTKSVQAEKNINVAQNKDISTKPVLPITESLNRENKKINYKSHLSGKVENIKSEESANLNSNEIIQNKTNNFILISNSKPAYISNRVNLNDLIINTKNMYSATIINTPEKQGIDYFINDIEKSFNFSVELKGLVNWNIPEETISPSYYNKLNNYNLTCFLNIIENMQIGFDIRQETFFVKYKGNENNGKDYEYEQQPNFTTLSLAAKYNYNLAGSTGLIGQFIIGGNSFGVVGRIAAGIDYNMTNYISFITGVEFSSLLFVYQNKMFNADKGGLFFGISYKF